MSNNITYPSGEQISTLEVTPGVHLQNTRIFFGADAGPIVPVDPTNPMPINNDNLDSILYLLSEIRSALPRVDGKGKMFVSHAESNPTVALAAGQTLATVTGVTTVSSVSSVAVLSNLGGSFRPADGIPLGIAAMSAMTIYNNLVVT